MKQVKLPLLLVVILAVAGIGFAENYEKGKKQDVLSGSIEGLVIDNMLNTELELVEGIEIVVTRLVIPPNTELLKHWHPGEEFVYILEGSGELLLDGQEEMSLKKGDLVKVPLKKVHTARTGESSVEALIFRVHESGQPARVLVD